MAEKKKTNGFKLKRIGRRGKIAIWLVDGQRIRNELDIEFTNFGQHFRFPFIPEYEFWLDREAVPNERRFFIDYLLIEWDLMKKGFSYLAAGKIADQKSKSEREKDKRIKKTELNDAALMKKLHCRLLGKADRKTNIWLADGRLVRSAFRIEFTEGGHDLVYDFVPENEVWIDDDVLASERPYVILHELFERSLMDKEKLTYGRAHRRASRLEWRCRHSKEELNQKLADLGWQANSSSPID